MSRYHLLNFSTASITFQIRYQFARKWCEWSWALNSPHLFWFIKYYLFYQDLGVYMSFSSSVEAMHSFLHWFLPLAYLNLDAIPIDINDIQPWSLLNRIFYNAYLYVSLHLCFYLFSHVLFYLFLFLQDHSCFNYC